MVVVDVVVDVTGGGMDVVVVVYVVVLVVVETGGPTAVRIGSSKIIVSVPTTCVLGTVVIVQLPQGGAVGAVLGITKVVGFVTVHDTLACPSGPIKTGPAWASGNPGGGDHGDGPETPCGIIVVPEVTVGVGLSSTQPREEQSTPPEQEELESEPRGAWGG